jgi:hypothetical protein
MIIGFFVLLLLHTSLVSGQTEPLTQPDSLVFTNIKPYSFSMSFSASQADGYLVVRSIGQAVSFVPQDNVFYQIGQGVGNGKVVSAGNATYLNINDVVENTAYFFAVYAFNTDGTSINYKQDNPLEGSVWSAQSNPGSYYAGILFNSPDLINDLTALLNNHTHVAYSNYANLVVPVIYERDTIGGKKVVTCDYSGELKIYNPPFTFSATGYSREHIMPRSWMPSGGNTSMPEGADYHNLALTNQNNVNSLRSNYPFGMVVTPTTTYLQCKLGEDAFNKTVFEPRNIRKGDVARALFYQIVCYNGVAGNWAFNYLPSLGTQQNIELLINWHFNDLPDAFEKAKNEYIFSVQNNRNPFIDFPDLVNCIDFSTLIKNAPCNDVSTGSIKGSNDDILVFPNPAKEIISLFIENTEHMIADEVVLYDYLGRKKVALTGPYYFPFSLDVSFLMPGCYYLTIKNLNGRIIRKKFFVL